MIFAFRSTFPIKYFQHAHGLEPAAAGFATASAVMRRCWPSARLGTALGLMWVV